MMVLTDHSLSAMLTSLTATSALFDGVYYGLYTNSTSPDHLWDISSVTEPTYTGYARLGPVVWGSKYEQPDDSVAKSDSAVEEFQATGSTGLPTVVYGYFLADAATAGNLLAAEAFPGGPITLNNTSDAVLLVGQIAFGGDSFPGSGTIIS